MHGQHVCIILAHFNGEKFIEEQVQSIIDQDHEHWHLFILDDKSKPESVSVLKKIRKKYQSRVTLGFNQNNIGYAQNFFAGMIQYSDKFDYCAFCDQDDIWNSDKLSRALKKLASGPVNKPKIYCSRTELVSEDALTSFGHSPLFKRSPSFGNALVQSIAGGNTMVLNRAAKDLVRDLSKGKNFVSHDWWCYQLITGCGGLVIYDAESSLKYRQHSDNCIGSNKSFWSRVRRVYMLLEGQSKRWNDMNIDSLMCLKDALTQENKTRLEMFAKNRQGSMFQRLKFALSFNVYRQTIMGNLGMLLGFLIKKM